MRPPILFLTVAFGVGLWAGLDPFVFPGRALPGGALWVVALPVLAVAAWLARRAPLGAAVRHMGVAGGGFGSGRVLAKGMRAITTGVTGCQDLGKTHGKSTP